MSIETSEKLTIQRFLICDGCGIKIPLVTVPDSWYTTRKERQKVSYEDAKHMYVNLNDKISMACFIEIKHYCSVECYNAANEQAKVLTR